MPLSSLDTSLFSALNKGLNVPALDPVMVIITDYNPAIFLGLFLIFWRLKQPKAFLTLFLALAAFGAADWTAHMVKDIVQRTRPCNTLDDIVLLVRCTKGFSMPSNHAANSFAFALPFVLMGKDRFRFAFLGFAALVAYSRVYVGVHYPFDILAGAALGSAYGIVSVLIYHYVFLRRHAGQSKDKTPPEVTG